MVLQGWNKNKTVIRECTEGEIPTINGKYLQDGCKEPKFEIMHNNENHPLFIFPNKWSHLTLEKYDETLYLKKNGKEIIQYTSSVLPKMRYILFHSKATDGLFKVHKHQYLEINEQKKIQLGGSMTLSCLAMFIKMCNTCSLRITITKLSGYELEEQIHSKVNEWKEIKIHLNREERIVVYVSTQAEKNTKQPFWAIDDVRQCGINDLRFIEKEIDDGCELITENKETYQLTEVDSGNEVSPCSINEFGLKHCLPLHSISQDNCEKLQYCELSQSLETKCSCSAGFYGLFCISICFNRYSTICV
ncbi:uncharacterized protein LOC126266462 [Aethina tumida]|uniref:uncharacterized protein LOC126266462 n=1 Tax=Aethina tumida TaxID=116153 RepID=UPI0021496AE8|nr:uncharacterized protein LOC126266462 [Aethina tumida]